MSAMAMGAPPTERLLTAVLRDNEWIPFKFQA